MTDNAIRVSELNKSFGAKQVLFDLSLHIEPGEMVALIGSSGSGKSTLLRHLAGLTQGDAGAWRGMGRVDVLGNAIQCGGRISRNIRRQRARIGYIFQQFNLVGRMSVIGNVLLGSLGRIPRWRGVCGLFSEAERRQALDALERVGMAEYAQRRAYSTWCSETRTVVWSWALIS
jgi:phosphonate transport system ATP-binding protein